MELYAVESLAELDKAIHLAVKVVSAEFWVIPSILNNTWDCAVLSVSTAKTIPLTSQSTLAGDDAPSSTTTVYCVSTATSDIAVPSTKKFLLVQSIFERFSKNLKTGSLVGTFATLLRYTKNGDSSGDNSATLSPKLCIRLKSAEAPTALGTVFPVWSTLYEYNVPV